MKSAPLYLRAPTVRDVYRTSLVNLAAYNDFGHLGHTSLG